MRWVIIHEFYVLFIIRKLLDTLFGWTEPVLRIPRSAVRKDVSLAVSFAKGGFNMAYTGGPLRFIELHPSLFSNAAFLGNSTGSVIAALAGSQLDSDVCFPLFERFCEQARVKGPAYYHRLMHFAGIELEQMLPDDAHARCSGRVVLAYTELSCRRLYMVLTFPLLWLAFLLVTPESLAQFSAVLTSLAIGLDGPTAKPGKRGTVIEEDADVRILVLFFTLVHSVIICSLCVHSRPAFQSHFANNAELVDVVRRSCSIPMVQDLWPLRAGDSGRWYIDGGFMSSILVLDATETVTVNWDRNALPQADVAPPFDMPFRVVTAPEPSVVRKLLAQGEQDCKSFFLAARNKPHLSSSGLQEGGKT